MDIKWPAITLGTVIVVVAVALLAMKFKNDIVASLPAGLGKAVA